MMIDIFLFVPLFIILGFIIGILASLCGLGGGFLVAPILVIVFNYLGIPNGIKFAIGTSLFVVFINSIVSFIRHMKHYENFNIEWKSIIALGITGLVFSKLSSFLVVNYINTYILKKLFGIFLITIGIYLVKSGENRDHYKFYNVSIVHFIVYGIIAGLLAGLFGIGGGITIIPIMSLFKYPIKRVIKITISVVPLISIGGVITYLTANTQNYIYNVGYVSIPIALITVVPIIYSSKLGLHIHQKISPRYLRIILGTILGGVGLVMIY